MSLLEKGAPNFVKVAEAYGIRGISINNRQELIACLKEKGIETRAVFTPMHKHPYYNDSNIFPNAELISSTGLDIPTSPALTEQEVRYVATTIRDLQ